MILANLWQSLRKGSLVASLGTFCFLATSVVAPAQEPVKGRNLVRSGYTRPGTPADREKNGKVIPIYYDDTIQKPKKIMGGTVYFAVYERTGTEGDVWGTGLAGFDEAFAQGRSFKGKFSPNLDTKAKYLYLYQVVNDRGLDPPANRIRPAALFGNDPPQPLVSTSVRLLVDPRFITSWGHFQHNSFSALVADRNLVGLAAGGAEAKKTRIAFSANPSILEEVQHKRYEPYAPANPLGELRQGFGIGLDTVGLKTAAATKELEKEVAGDGVKAAVWKKNLLAASKSAKEPAYVQLLYTDPDAAEPLPGAPLPEEFQFPRAYFRADWVGDQILQVGQHSMIFGFTSDLPPIDEEVRLYDADAAKGGPINMMANAEGDKPGTAPGTVPTPEPPPPAALPFCNNNGGAGLIGRQGTGGFGMPGLFGAGGIGFARAPIFVGGGGFGGGSGGGSGSSTPTTSTSTGTNTGTGTGTTTNTANTQSINFAPVLTNTQAQNQVQNQAQAQQQQQQQQQQQVNNNHPVVHNHVVPAPAALLLGLFGLPALLFLRRRKPGDTPVPPQA